MKRITFVLISLFLLMAINVPSISADHVDTYRIEHVQDTIVTSVIREINDTGFNSPKVLGWTVLNDDGSINYDVYPDRIFGTAFVSAVSDDYLVIRAIYSNVIVVYDNAGSEVIEISQSYPNQYKYLVNGDVLYEFLHDDNGNISFELASYNLTTGDKTNYGTGEILLSDFSSDLDGFGYHVYDITFAGQIVRVPVHISISNTDSGLDINYLRFIEYDLQTNSTSQQVYDYPISCELSSPQCRVRYEPNTQILFKIDLIEVTSRNYDVEVTFENESIILPDQSVTDWSIYFQDNILFMANEIGGSYNNDEFVRYYFININWETKSYTTRETERFVFLDGVYDGVIDQSSGEFVVIFNPYESETPRIEASYSLAGEFLGTEDTNSSQSDGDNLSIMLPPLFLAPAVVPIIRWLREYYREFLTNRTPV